MILLFVLVGWNIVFTDSQRILQEPKLVLSLTKTRCMGECPAFKFELYNNHEASYKGEAFVPLLGEWSAKLTPEQYSYVVKQFTESSFFEMEDRYYQEITDLPSTYLYYADGEREKKILDYYGAPPELKALEKTVDDLNEKLNWKKSTP